MWYFSPENYISDRLDYINDRLDYVNDRFFGFLYSTDGGVAKGNYSLYFMKMYQGMRRSTVRRNSTSRRRAMRAAMPNGANAS